MGAFIRVFVQPFKYPSEHDREIAIALEEDIIQEVFAPIDLPSLDADAITRELICTSTVEIRRIRMERKDLARLLSAKITVALVEAMGGEDTTMGYKDND